MTRRGMSEDRRRAASLQAGRRLISRGERPLYRVKVADGGAWAVEGAPWWSGAATTAREILALARLTIAADLEVSPDAFDVALV